MADSRFERAPYLAALRTRALGRALVARASAASTNDLAWEGLARGAPDGAVFLADVQTAGRGRDGRRWEAAPGQGLLFSMALRLGCEPSPVTLLPLLAGLATARGVASCGADPSLKWPNDVLLAGRKLAGVLCESRGLEGAERALVIGIGVNVSQTAPDFPPGLRDTAISLRMAGHACTREGLLAEILNAFEPLLDDFQEGAGAERLLLEWRERAAFWGKPVTVRTPAGPVTGVASGLDPAGGLVLKLADGRETVAVAGELELPAAEGPP